MADKPKKYTLLKDPHLFPGSEIGRDVEVDERYADALVSTGVVAPVNSELAKKAEGK